MSRSNTPLTIVNVFGTLGYLSGILQWAWTIMILLYPAIIGGRILLIPEQPHQTPAEPIEFGALTPVVMAVAAFITVLVILSTAVVLARLPKAIGRTGAKTTQTVAKAVIPNITHHKRMPKKRYVTLSYRLIVCLKYALALLPLSLLMFAPTIEALPIRVILVIGLITASFTVGYFSLQVLLTQLLHVDKKSVW